mmetsp:Transcript_5160/g.7984  ORF Transcript_5160/g.7984 Transcript_5160/m.7984 type:complete len:103 (-) Transcript_5160:154-462(-)
MAAIQTGKVFLDGLQIKAELRSAMKRPPPPVHHKTETRRDLDFSSRDFYMEQGTREKTKDRDRRRRSPSKSRSRGRGRSQSRSRDRSRGRSHDRDRRRRGRS